MKDSIGLPGGVWPVLVTPYDEQLRIDYDAFRRMVDWYLEQGVDGMFASCLSSESYDLSSEERMQLTQVVLDRVNGRVPVVVGAMGWADPTERIEAIKSMHAMGADAVIMAASELVAEHESDEKLEQVLMAIVQEADGIDLGLYECPKPYHRLLGLPLIGTLAKTNRFVFMKDTCCDIDIFKERLEVVEGTRLELYNAHSPIMLDAIKLGSKRFNGIGADVVPQLYAQLFEQSEIDLENAEMIQAFLNDQPIQFHYKHPLTVKACLNAMGITMQVNSRYRSEALSENDQVMIRKLVLDVSDFYETLSSKTTSSAS
ncbi:dihydrodipicolinate synthase family protein [Poriferisphaera sp. WC338]|uniref:dihydrodipicolinate synthase family protein n=1 Tax=Poriferisphaera sp. WC338 TaxID=3425129 RepID=UPI003D818B68